LKLLCSIYQHENIIPAVEVGRWGCILPLALDSLLSMRGKMNSQAKIITGASGDWSPNGCLTYENYIF
uniref:Uncharacterized protein n=1 Tax=Oryzias latipes TaxID=8090 RepID=A0A3P9KEM4_ORYLA